MLAQFPTFTPITLDHYQIFQQRIGTDIPSSDHYFVGMWAWDTSGCIQISMLHDNLVLQQRDYLTLNPFLSLIGTSNIPTTLSQLHAYTIQMGYSPTLRLIHPVTIPHCPSQYMCTEDRDNYDYIYSIRDLLSLSGTKFHQKKKLLNKFNNTYPSAYSIVTPLTDLKTQVQILRFYRRWERQKSNSAQDYVNEWIALERMIDIAPYFPIQVLSLYVDSELIGYSIFEQINQDYAISSFQKTSIHFRGSNEKITHEVALTLHSQGCSYINVEQDLGIAGLRAAKLAYNPIFLKKYTITPRFTSQRFILYSAEN